jgi:predicted negative regulator of RcsB-dependent stress response
MRCQSILLLGVFTAGAFVGCAYFNGLYNANQLVKEAHKAEREGRIGEAYSLWSQAAVKAESVATQYPNSRYRDDALLLQGLALAASEQCVRAITPLRQAIEVTSDSVTLLRATLQLGRCHYETGEYGSAVEVLTPLVNYHDTLWAQPARLWRGRALLAVGAYEPALADLGAVSGLAAAFDQAVAFTRLERPESARSALAARIDSAYDEHSWLQTLDTVGYCYPDVASSLVDLVLQRSELTPSQRARLLLNDGLRWAARNRWSDAVNRFEQVETSGSDSTAARIAKLQRILARARMSADLGDLFWLADSLEQVVLEGGTETSSEERSVLALRSAADAAALTLDGQVTRGGIATDQRDLEIFLAAEGLRDIVRAPVLAAALFRRLQVVFPHSVIAPKALIAAAVLDEARSDSLLGVVQLRYPTSPYTLALDGIVGDEYTVVEDSLRTLLAGRQSRSREQ